MTKDTSDVVARLDEQIALKRDCSVCDGDGIKDSGRPCGGCEETGKVLVHRGPHAALLADAMALISSLVAENAELLNRAEVAEYKQAQAVNEIQPMIIARAETAERLLADARAALEPFADFGEYLEVETEGFADDDELALIVEKSGFRLERFKIGAFRKARASIGGGNG